MLADRSRGVALMLVLFAVVIATVLSLTFLNAQNTSSGIAANAKNHAQARLTAESALEMVIQRVKASDTWRSDFTNGAWVTDEPLLGGTYTVVGEDGEDLDADGVIDGDGDLADNSTDPLTLTVTGTHKGATHRIRTTLVFGLSVVSQIAVINKVELKSDSIVDSFHSLAGPYDAGTAGSEAIVSTNSTAKEMIKLRDRAKLQGDAYAGVGGNVTQVIKLEGSSQITGNKDKLTEAVMLPIISMPNSVASSGSKTLSSGTTTYSTDQRFGNFEVKGTAVVNVSGEVTIQVDGEFKMSGTAQINVNPGGKLTLYVKKKTTFTGSPTINATNAKPSAVHIYHLGADHLDFGGSSITYATVVSPYGMLHLKDSAQLMGTYGGFKLTVEGTAQLHQDLDSGFPYMVPPGSATGFAVDDVLVVKDSAVIDSYDSSLGSYGGLNQGSSATISTNSTSSDKLKVEGTAIVKGIAFVGSGGNPINVIKMSSGAQITGGASSLPAEINIPAITDPEDLIAVGGDLIYTNGNNFITTNIHCNKLTVKGTARLTISGNVYIYVDDALLIDETAEIKLNDGASVEIYVRKSIAIQGSAVVNDNTKNPAALMLYSIGTDNMTIGDNAVVHGTVVTDSSEFLVKSQATFFGTFRGKKAQVTGTAKVHVDMLGLEPSGLIANTGSFSTKAYWLELP